MLGCGFHSIVKKVEHCPTGRIFARKTIRNAGKGISIVERFRTEVNIMKRLNHPHIIRFVAEYMDNLSFHVIMSPVAEHNLKECLDNPETLPQNHVLLKSIGCLASAVAYLHSVRVRHKDIKPQNILVKDSKVFLTDFGISKTWTDVESTTDSVSAMTPMYAAPEVAARGKHGTKADVFSLGLVFLEII
ncbi:kinase-like protein, partial [Glonium stellatum]